MKVAGVNSTSTTPACYSPVEDLLQVRNLTVRYFTEDRAFTAVKDLTFTIAPGEIVALLGESGCGKTTAALSLLRVLPENTEVSGSVLLGGRDLISLSEPRLRAVRGAQIALIYQDSSVLNPVIRVGSQVCEVLRAHGVSKLRDAREKVLSLFTSIGLTECERIYEAYPHQLSRGQRQRIAVAQALICDPDLVIADEPTASVDPETATEILDCMRRMREETRTSFLIISHDPDALTAVADRVIVMYAGQIVEEGPLAEVYSRPLHPYTQALLQCSLRRAEPLGFERSLRLPFISGNSPDPLEHFPGCSFAARCKDRMQVCDALAPELFEPSYRRFTRCFKYESESDHA